MKSNKRNWLILSLILFALIGDASAAYSSYACIFADGNQCSDGSEPTVMCDPDPGGNCHIICAAECGSSTPCISGSCDTCCAAGVCSIYGAGSDERDACMSSCEGTCEVNTEFCGIIIILQSIALGLATLMLTVNGFKWMSADNASGRVDARRGLYYVFIGLLIIIISFALVNYLYVGEISCPI